MYFGEIPAGSVPLETEQEVIHGVAASPLLIVPPEPTVVDTPMGVSGEGQGAHRRF